MTLTVMDWFCGAGGSSQGIDAVPGVEVTLAANHWQLAIDSHASNFPRVRHERGDIRDLPVHRWPVATGFWASPECKKWTGARGKKRDYAAADTPLPGLPGLQPTPPEEDERSRALMWDVPKYLEGVQRRGKLVLFGVVENVVEARTGRDWDRWLRDFHHLGYKTRLIAFNSMHAQHTRTPRSPQSRDRLYLAYWHTSLGRDPDFDKWLRPQAYCPGCDRDVYALQVFKTPGRDMGRYRQQYVYRCPHTTCRNRVVEPAVLPAAAAIDWSLPGQRIGDRAKPLAEKTIRRIEAGLKKFARPLVLSADGTWRNDAVPVAGPLPTRTTRKNDGLAWMPYMVELRGGSSDVRSIHEALATVTASGNHHGLVAPPAAMVMRNNGSTGDGGEHCTSAADPLRTLTTAGHQSLVTWEHLLVPYYGNGTARTVREPVGALSTRDRYALIQGDVDIDDVLFRMLEPHEIGRAMAFAESYVVLGSKRERVCQYGNAVTPPVAELLTSALAETVTGEDLDRHPDQTWSIAA